MIQNALAIALIVFAILGGLTLNECVFLASLRGQIWTDYGGALLAFSSLLILNLTAAAYAVIRKLTLKETGDKLSHLEKQLRGRTTISEELTERILDRK